MTEINNCSKRFFADFIAARLMARRMEKDAPQQTHAEASPGSVPGIEDATARPSDRTDSRPGELPSTDHTPQFLPGLGSSN